MTLMHKHIAVSNEFVLDIPNVSRSDSEPLLGKASLLLDITTAGTNTMINANVDRYIIAFMKRTKSKMKVLNANSVQIYGTIVKKEVSKKHVGQLFMIQTTDLEKP